MLVCRFKLILFIFLLLLLFGFQSYPSIQNLSKITLTEIMYDPIGSEYYDEFVEIYNLSKDTINFSGWQIGDKEGFDQIVDAGCGTKLAPGQFGLILDSGYFNNSTTYDSLISEEALVLTIDGASFGQRGLSNSVAKSVVLLDSLGVMVDQYTYSLSNKSGYSDEKIDLTGLNLLENWNESLYLNGTPGFRNSVSPREKDFALTLVNFPIELPNLNEEWQIGLKIKNRGLAPAENYQLIGYEFFNKPVPDSILVYEKSFLDTLKIKEEIDILIDLTAETSGIKEYHFYLLWEYDQYILDNFVIYTVIIPFQSSDIVINEVMYYPEVGSPEWLEIYNYSNYDIDLQQWNISTESTLLNPVTLSSYQLIFEKGDFLVLTNDSLNSKFMGEKWLYVKNLPRLRDAAEEIYLYDPSGEKIEVILYESIFGKRRGYSLERIWYERAGSDSLNWRLTANFGGTPALFNSNSPLDVDLKLVALNILPNPATYLIDPNLFITVQNTGRSEILNLEILIFSDVNKDSIPQADELILPTEFINTVLAVEDTITKKYSLSGLQLGIYNLSVLVNVDNDQNVNNNIISEEIKVGYPPNMFIINEIMYYPMSGDPEWIEIYNPSNDFVNIREWNLYEPLSKKSYEITNQTIIILPNSFLVISSDSNLTVPLESKLIVPSKFPSLNNDFEKIQLLDFSHTLIDSVVYSSNWGGDLGISLERINPTISSQDSSNWASSASVYGMTPGEQNSIFTSVLPTDVLLSASPNPFSPDGDGHEDFAIIQYELPMKTAYVSLKIYDVLGRQVCELLNTVPSGSSQEVIWNGKRNNGENLRIGVYILFLEALNTEMGLIKQIKKPIVIAGKF